MWLFDRCIHCERRRQWHPTPVLLPGKSHGWRSLVGCGPWGHEESDTTEWLHFQFSVPCIGEGKGNPLQCSCLENPRDGGAWWAAVYGVAQSQTRLKQLSSSIHCERIPLIKLIICHLTHIPFFVWECLSSALLESFSYTEFTVVTTIYARLSDLIHHITDSLNPFTNLSYFPHPLAILLPSFYEFFFSKILHLGNTM